MDGFGDRERLVALVPERGHIGSRHLDPVVVRPRAEVGDGPVVPAVVGCVGIDYQFEVVASEEFDRYLAIAEIVAPPADRKGLLGRPDLSPVGLHQQHVFGRAS